MTDINGVGAVQVTPQQVLEKKFGLSEFRGLQEKTIQNVLAGKNTLLLMPTGMGKSLCYQIPSCILPGLTLVISPLIALIKDQADKAQERGLRCGALHSAMKPEERHHTLELLGEGELDLLYVTPERFRKRNFLQALNKNKVSLLAIDEAHCISQWGHDFRPDYTRIAEFREILGSPITLALTATATTDVQNDILLQAGMEAEILHSGVDRPNLNIMVREVVGEAEKVRSFAALRAGQPGPMIAYFALISSLEKFSYEISRLGIEHWQYHGSLSAKDRKRNQEKFLQSSDGVILATPAFGLGVDKDNVRAVVHVEIPGSIEAYYQELGRAGRDGKPAECTLLYDSDDATIQMDFIKWSNPDPGFIRAIFNLIKRYPMRLRSEGTDFLREQMNFYNRRDFRVETALNLLKRWGVIDGDFSRKEFVILEEPTSDFFDSVLDQDLYEKRLMGQNKKLLALIQLLGQDQCRKQVIYKYFSADSDLDSKGISDEECGQCDVCLPGS